MDNNLNNPALAHGIGAVIMIVILGLSLIELIAGIFYILSLQKALNRCAPENRAMDPGLIWLLLIPCFNFIWHFFVVINMAKSLGAEFQKRGITEEREPGKTIGLVASVLWVCSLIPFLNYLCHPAALVCWIIYWVKIAGFSKKLEA
jgi:predicted membrane channel-forming protein YqfA (hemolysin III family)